MAYENYEEETMSPELTEIKVEGNDAEVDFFAACIEAAVRYWGRDYDYDFIAGLSGSAFSPVWWMEESCAAWWTEFGNDSRIRFLGKAVGFYIVESPDVSDEDFAKTGELPSEMEKFWNRVKDAVQEGKIVLMHTWPCWSIITEWNDDIAKLGLASVSSMGGMFCAPYRSAKMYILTPGAAEMTRAEAYKEALKFGADVADGTYKRPGFAYGGKLYDAILGKAGDEYFCGDCKEKSWSCACRTMNRVEGSNRSADRFLEEADEFIGSQLPEPVVDTVRSGYRTVADYAGSYTNCEMLRDNWDQEKFRDEFYNRVTHMKLEHGKLSKAFRRLADTISQ